MGWLNMIFNNIVILADLFYDAILNIYQIIRNLTGEQITLLSIFVTFIIYLLGKRSELNLKKYESKKQQYIKLITLLEKIYSQNMPKDKSGNLKITQAMKTEFFDLGSSLLLYGSKNLYKQYVFYREFASNPIIEKCKYFDNSIILYIMADMLTTIRKEVGLSKLDSITAVESLAFFVNNVATNPLTKVESYKAHYKIRMIKLELFFIDRIKFVYTQKIFNYLIRPIYGIVNLLLKYLILIPLGRCIIKLFPNSKHKLVDSYNELNSASKEINKGV